MTNWTRKLAAWLHDPAEKALILLRDREGHEHGTAARLRAQLGVAASSFDKRADWLAAAADRPQWPRDATRRFPAWEQVVFARTPQLVHPLSGERIDLTRMTDDLDVERLKALSQAHFESLIDEAGDARRTFLAFWRFGPELARLAPDLGALWAVQPADTRVPDHTIWNHVDIVAAIHTALAGDEQGPDEPALLAMSFGPVQGFISQARSTSDLWAGSHLLSSLVWHALQTIVQDLGPDVVVFPALRGVPAVDRWLAETGGTTFRERFAAIHAEFLNEPTDTNPLFAASLPNKFVAIVPSRRARALAEQAIAEVQKQALVCARKAAELVFKAADTPITEETYAQIASQLDGFPEAYWAAATWPVAAHDQPDAVAAAAEALRAALDTIDPALRGRGVFDKDVWATLAGELKLEGITFYSPNSGVLYPAVYEIADRGLAAAKAVRPFAPLKKQEGHRCTLTGEHEWLTHERTLLMRNRTDRKTGGSVWSRLAKEKPAWVKPGEHLGAIATLKRLWPVLFAVEVGEFLRLPDGERVRRFVVSTHALALSTSIERLADEARDGLDDARRRALAELTAGDLDPSTLPHSLMKRLQPLDRATREALRRLPTALDAAEDKDAIDAADHPAGDARALSTLFGDARPETYYALIQMDGDHMGGWLAGNEDAYRLPYRKTWHSNVVDGTAALEARHAPLKRYLDTLRPISPARHAAISQALNDFSTHLARHVVEDCCKGKLLYAGGDDVLALVAVDDLFDCMQLLRLAYSGIAPHELMGLGQRVGEFDPAHAGGDGRLLLKNGFGWLRDRHGSGGRLMTLMGHKATASMGAVVAHHTAPLAMVLRQLREAETTAKNTARISAAGNSEDRDAFCLRVLKRGGGEVSLVSPWWSVVEGTPDTSRSGLALMKRVAQELAAADFSRAAIYRAQLWFQGLTAEPRSRDETGNALTGRPEGAVRASGADAGNEQHWREQLAATLAWQFDRQGGSRGLAREVVDYVCDVVRPNEASLAVVENFLACSEFFAREARSFQLGGRDRREQRKAREAV